MLTKLLLDNLDLVFLIYGLAFFAVGMAILMQRRKDSAFKLGDILWLLGWFGISHGTNEWLDMLGIIKGYHTHLWDYLRASVLTLSYIFLFEFGRRLIFLSFKRFHIRWTVILSFFTVIFMFIFKYDPTIWPRYFLGLPGAVFMSVGFAFYYRNNKSILKLFKIRRYFLSAAVFAFIYGLIGGLIVSKASFFPASVINNDSFLNLTGIPVQVFRAICAIVLALSTYNILNIFDWELVCELKSGLSEVTTAKIYMDNILKAMVDVLIVADTSGNIKSVNDAACELLGYKREELTGKPAKIFFEGDTPFEGAQLKELIAAGHAKNDELSCITKNKRKIPMVFSESIVINVKGEITGVLAVGKDVSECRGLQEKLVRADKLAALGRVAGIIGHDVKNQLGVMRNSVYLIKMKLEDNKDEKIKKHLDMLDEVIVETDRIIENILAFSRTKPPEFKKVDLKNLLLDCIEKVGVPPEVEVVNLVDKNLPKIPADKIQLTQVFINLITNAVQAMEERGKLTIKVTKEDSFACIAVQDTGCGIKEEDRDKIFELFFSTKSRGMGLGLATSRLIVEAHGGNISIESNVGKGTSVVVKLPIKE